jgi:hypothetical protein
VLEFRFVAPRAHQARAENLLANVEVLIPERGIKVVGGSVWRSKDGISVTLPSRKYETEKGEDGFYEFFRPINEGDWPSVKELKDDIKAAFEKHQAQPNKAVA